MDFWIQLEQNFGYPNINWTLAVTQSLFVWASEHFLDY